MPVTDTIFALSSGAVKAGVSVFRLSGPDAFAITKKIAGHRRLTPRMTALRTLKALDRTSIDEGLVVTFPAPNSFTGEDCVEFHTHGSLAVIEAMSGAFLSAGARHAGPGEFTRRAFENGKLDLTEAEGLADLIDSETEGQRQQAFRQMQGGLKEVYQSWRAGLIDALAAIEGDIDFPDEQDVPDNLSHAAYEPITKVIEHMEKTLADSQRGESVRRGIRIAIIGPPNAGKSSILNLLAGRDAAIVSDQAGTTRDIIDVQMNIEGFPVIFSDTAGIRETEDSIEAEGVRRALASSEDADIRIGVASADTGGFDDLSSNLDAGDFLLLNKSDQKGLKVEKQNFEVLTISAKTGDGFGAFFLKLADAIKTRFALTENAGLTRARHKDCTQRAIESLRRAQSSLRLAPELAGDDVRSALHAIKELAGEADIEAVLGAIFSRFCIGK